MSKIIKKEELDLVIENVLRENGFMGDTDETEEETIDEMDETDEDEIVEEIEDIDEDCDVVEESTNKLKTAIENSTASLIKEDLDNFKRLMNHRN